MIALNFILFAVIIIIALLYLHLIRHFNYWKSQNVPYFKPIPLFGSIFSICAKQKSIMSFLNSLYDSTTLPCIGFFVFDQPFLLIRDPGFIKKILVSDFDHFEDRSGVNNKKDKYSSKLLFNLKEPKSRTVRIAITPLFSSAKLKHMVPLMLEAGDGMVNYIQSTCVSEDSTDCKEISIKHAIEVISSTAFGFKINSYKDSKFVTASKEMMGATPIRLFHVAAHIFAPMLVKILNLKFLNANSTEYLEQVMLNTIKERKNTKMSRPDLIDLIIKIQKIDPVLFDTDQIVAISLQYLLAGFETSGNTIAFALYELCLNTSMQDRLRNEIFLAIGKHGTVTYDAIQEMKYLEMVIKETLRKYPPGIFLDRRCTKTYKIPNTDVVIKKGIPVYIPVFALHYDKNYFPNPSVFDPERFSPENKSLITPYTYIPFGDGYRNCLGTRLGMLMVSIALIKILTSFKVLKSKDTPTSLSFENSGLLLVPKNNAIFVKFSNIE